MLGVCVTGGYEHGVEDQSLLFPEVDLSKGVGCTLVVCLQVGIPRFDDA
jgi:hypothetical protein